MTNLLLATNICAIDWSDRVLLALHGGPWDGAKASADGPIFTVRGRHVYSIRPGQMVADYVGWVERVDDAEEALWRR